MVWIKILEEGNREYYDSEGQREAVWMWRLEMGGMAKREIENRNLFTFSMKKWSRWTLCYILAENDGEKGEKLENRKKIERESGQSHNYTSPLHALCPAQRSQNEAEK